VENYLVECHERIWRVTENYWREILNKVGKEKFCEDILKTVDEVTPIDIIPLLNLLEVLKLDENLPDNDPLIFKLKKCIRETK